jgi:hypothetical protein
MMHPYAYAFQLLVFFLFSTVPIHAGESPRILIAVTEKDQNRDAENLLAKGFLESGFQVILSEQLTPSRWITAQDLSEADKGNLSKLRKTAAFSDASLIFEGRIKVAYSSEELLEMKMNKAVASISFKVLSTVSGRILETDCKSYREVSRSPEEARYGALKKMQADIAKTLIPKISKDLTSHDETQLNKFKKSSRERKGLPSPPLKSISAKQSAALGDTKPPRIILLRPVLNERNLVLTLKNAEVIEGQVKDESPLIFFRINDEDAEVDVNGYFTKTIVLKKGDRKFVLEALDKAGNRAKKEFMISKKPNALGVEATQWPSAGKPTLWGLAIGVSNYGSTATDLKYAHLDAQSLAGFLKEQGGNFFKEVHFITLVNQEVTRDTVLETISSHLGKATEDDVAFIFIAGHGIKHPQTGSYYFMPHDADFNTALSKGLRMSDFDEAINILSRNVRKVIVAMDTCHAGAMKGIGERVMDGGEDLVRALNAASGRFILAASKGGEASLEDEKFKLHDQDLGHGAFTYALIKGMSGESDYDGDRCITLQELSHYVAKQVPRLTDGRQHPYFRSEGTDMPFILLGK